MNPFTAIVLIWSWHMLWMTLTTWTIGRAAYSHSGWPIVSRRTCRIIGHRCRFLVVRWPITGRWLLALLLASWVFVLGDVTRSLWALWLDGNEPHEPLTWFSTIIRAVPVPIGPWVFWRQWRTGLTNDHLS